MSSATWEDSLLNQIDSLTEERAKLIEEIVKLSKENTRLREENQDLKTSLSFEEAWSNLKIDLIDEEIKDI